MKLKHLAALAYRLLAAYFGFIAIQYGSMTALMSTPAMRFATRRNLPNWPNFAVPTLMYVLGAAALLWFSFRLAPKEDEEQGGPLEFDQFKNLAFMILGVYFFINCAPLLLSDLLSVIKPDLFQRAPGIDRWVYDIGATLAGLGLIVANAPKREPVPGFDEMRSQARKF